MDFGHQGVADWPSSFQNKSAVSCGVGLEVSTYFTIGMSHCQLNTCPRTKKCQPKSGLVPEDLGVPVWQGHAWRVLSGGSDSRIGGTGGENHPKTMAYCKRLEKMPSFWHDWYKLIYIYMYMYVHSSKTSLYVSWRSCVMRGLRKGNPSRVSLRKPIA